MKKLLIISVILFISIHVSAQTKYYVDQVNGNDSYDGTSLTKAWRTIQKACNVATTNSIVQIKAGTYNENIIVNVSGTLGNPITFKNYMNDIVLIDGSGTTGKTMLSISNKDYLNFENLTIQNKTANNAQGILVESSGANSATNLSFKNITIKNINWNNDALAIPNANNNAQGFIAYGSIGGIRNLTIDSCQVYNNILGFSEAISLDGNIDNFIIKNCNVYNNTNIGICLIGNYQTSSVPETDHAKHGLVTNNICHDNLSLYATSAGIYVDGGWNIIIERNTSYHNGNGIEIGCEENGTTDSIIVKNNIVYNNQITGMYVGGYTTATTGQVLNSTIRNNTFFQNNYKQDGTGEMAISKATNCTFENNIFYTNDQNILMSVDNISPQSNIAINYNCWYTRSATSNNITVNWKSSTYNTFGAYKAGTSQDSQSLFANPNLNNATLANIDLSLSSTSPCINSGNPSTKITDGEKDYTNNVRITSNTIDIGAYEFSVTTSIQTNNPTKNDLFIIYPNPITSKTNLFVHMNVELSNFYIYNSMGQMIYELKNISEEEISIQGDIFEAGIYFYTCMQNNKIIAEGKIIAQ
jgi:hypothetical protein